MEIEKKRIIGQVLEFLDNDNPKVDISGYLNDELNAIQKRINKGCLQDDKKWFLKVKFPCIIKANNKFIVAIAFNKKTEKNVMSLQLQDNTVLRVDCCDFIQEIN